MDLNTYYTYTELYKKTEIEKVLLISYYYFNMNSVNSFKYSDISNWFLSLNFSLPNISRLKSKMKASKDFISKGKSEFGISAKAIERLNETYDIFSKDNENIIDNESILPKSLYRDTKEYIERIAKQINSSYENNLTDCCAVMMRRLIEILLVLTFRNFNIEHEIISDSKNGKHIALEKIIDKAKASTIINLSANTRDDIDEYRELGNFSAHKIEYNCPKRHITDRKLKYSSIIQELLYKSGIKQ